jgi:hypothetical protein
MSGDGDGLGPAPSNGGLARVLARVTLPSAGVPSAYTGEPLAVRRPVVPHPPNGSGSAAPAPSPRAAVGPPVTTNVAEARHEAPSVATSSHPAASVTPPRATAAGQVPGAQPALPPPAGLESAARADGSAVPNVPETKRASNLFDPSPGDPRSESTPAVRDGATAVVLPAQPITLTSVPDLAHPGRPDAAPPTPAAPPVTIGRIDVHVDSPAPLPDPFAGCRVVAAGLTARRGGGW